MSDWDDQGDEFGGIPEEELIGRYGPDYEGVSQGVPVMLQRAVYRGGGELLVVQNRFGLANEGSFTGANFESRDRAGISIMEFGHSHTDIGWELTVSFLAEGKRYWAERYVTRWAGIVGYSRVWLPEKVVDPTNRPATHQRAQARCRSCGHRWHGRGRRFWRVVWRERLFPNVCTLCGDSVAQWKVAAPKPDRFEVPRERARRRAQRRREARQTESAEEGGQE